MQINDGHIDELFARKLGTMEATPPEDGWHRIESELNRRSRNSRKYWLMAASIALLLSVTASVIYWQTNSGTLHEEIASNIHESAKRQEQQSGTQQPNNRTSTNDKVAVPQQGVDTHTASGQATSHPDEVLNKNEGEKTNISAVSPSSDQDMIAQANTKSLSNQPVENTQTNIPVYVDSWEEIVKAQPLKLSRLDFPPKKITGQIPTMTEKPEQISSIPETRIPVYDEIAFVDVTDISAKPQKRNRWEVTGQFAPVYSYRTIASVPSGMRKSDFDQAESGLLAYSGGITVAYKVLSRFSVQTGVFYSQMGQSINSVTPVSNMYAAVSSNNSYAKNFVRTSSGNVSVASNMKSDINTTYASYFNAESQSASSSVTPNNISMAKVSQPVKYRLVERIDYLEIPLMVRYKVIDRKLNFYVLGGMSTNILIDNNVFMDNGSDLIKEGTILMARPVNYSSTFGIGLNYQFTPNLLIGLEPSFKYYLQSYSTSSQISSNPYAFGIFTGVMYRF